MKVLFLCEMSQICTIAFREKGHEAYSCDLLDCIGGFPEWHLKGDAFEVYGSGQWDLVISFPPCCHLAGSGSRWFSEKRKDGRQAGGIDFFLRIAKISNAVENPIGIMSSVYRKPDQIIQPWQFGHGETKATCLWLNGLPFLKSTNRVEGREERIFKMPTSSDRKMLRSLTYRGIAKAMSEQWGSKIPTLF